MTHSASDEPTADLDVGSTLALVRQRLGLKTRDLAAILRIDPRALVRLERGDDVPDAEFTRALLRLVDLGDHWREILASPNVMRRDPPDPLFLRWALAILVACFAPLSTLLGVVMFSVGVQTLDGLFMLVGLVLCALSVVLILGTIGRILPHCSDCDAIILRSARACRRCGGNLVPRSRVPSSPAADAP